MALSKALISPSAIVAFDSKEAKQADQQHAASAVHALQQVQQMSRPLLMPAQCNLHG
jgi:hypothetical protein